MDYGRSVLEWLCSHCEISPIAGIVSQQPSGVAPLDPYKIPDAVRNHAAWHRLDEQLSYYASRARIFQRRYQFAKIVQILLGAAIPVLVLASTRLPSSSSVPCLAQRSRRSRLCCNYPSGMRFDCNTDERPSASSASAGCCWQALSLMSGFFQRCAGPLGWAYCDAASERTG